MAALALAALLAAAGVGANARGDEAPAPRQVQILKPACDLRVAEPPVRGSLREHRGRREGETDKQSLWEFTLEADCSYALFDAPHAEDCLKGVWMVTVGASQTNIWTSQLANMLVPGTLITKQDNFSIDGVFTQLLDVVIRDGEVIYKNVVTDTTTERIASHTRERDKTVLRDAFGQVAEAPKFQDGDIRITNFFAEYWDHVGFALEAVEGAGDWSEAEVSLVATIGLWYVNSLHCDRANSWCATRPSLGKLSREGLVEQFSKDMAPAMRSLASFCSLGGRAARRGCAVASIDHCQFMQGEIWHQTHDAIREGLKGFTTPLLRYIDLWTLTMQIPEDCIGGHQSPMSTLWTWQVLLGGICDAKEAATGTFASFSGSMCRASQVHDACPDPKAKGFHYAWECGLSELCSMSAHEAPEGVRTLVVAGGSVSVDFTAASHMEEDTWLAEYRQTAQGYRWCLTVAAVAIAGVAAASGFHLSSAPSEKTYRPVGSTDDRQTPDQSLHRDEERRAPAPSSPPASKLPAEKFSFGLARCIASMHVVAGHLHASQATEDIYLFSWGFTWVPWFFTLSGFILFSAEAKNPRNESPIDYVARRAVTIYPLYAVSLLLALVIAKSRCEQPAASVLLLQAWLGQAWVPQVTERTLQMQCWFLSCLVLYWAAFQPLFQCVSSLNLGRTVAAIAAIFALPWLVVVAPLATGGNVDWFHEHSFGHSETPLDIGVVFLKFHPCCYLHVFVLGMLLGRLRSHVGTSADSMSACTKMAAQGVLQLLAPVGYAGLLCLFCVHSLRPPAAKLSTRLGALLPLQSCVLLGLAGLPGFERPLVAELAGRLNFLESYSYAVYVLQFICWRLWPSDKAGISFFFFLAAAAVVTVHAVQKPVEGLVRKSHKLLWAGPFALSVVLLGLGFLPDLDCSPDLPALLQMDDRLVDVRLPLQAENGEGWALINPSIVFHEHGLVVAARRHRRQRELTQGTYEGEDVAVIEETWHSDIVLGTVALGWTDWEKWLLTGRPPELAKLPVWSGLRDSDGGRWARLCVRETWVPENKTLVRLVVTGPEDPKVFQLGGASQSAEVALAFSSYPPLGRHGCKKGEAVPQMFLAGSVNPLAPAERSTGRPLACGESTRAEKNWIPFESRGQLHFVYSVLPHVVFQVNEDGSCGERLSSSFAPLARLQGKLPGVAIRGSANAVLIDDVESTPNLPQPHFLALLHVVDPRTHRYAHFAYRFGTTPPFDILQVSEQLPLRAARSEEGGPAFAFASGLAVRDRQVVVTYAAGDRDPRAMTLTLWRLDKMFHFDSEVNLDDNVGAHAEGAGARSIEM